MEALVERNVGNELIEAEASVERKSDSSGDLLKFLIWERRFFRTVTVAPCCFLFGSLVYCASYPIFYVLRKNEILSLEECWFYFRLALLIGVAVFAIGGIMSLIIFPFGIQRISRAKREIGALGDDESSSAFSKRKFLEKEKLFLRAALVGPVCLVQFLLFIALLWFSEFLVQNYCLEPDKWEAIFMLLFIASLAVGIIGGVAIIALFPFVSTRLTNIKGEISSLKEKGEMPVCKDKFGTFFWLRCAALCGFSVLYLNRWFFDDFFNAHWSVWLLSGIGALAPIAYIALRIIVPFAFTRERKSDPEIAALQAVA